jgi:hypothetical protein
MKYFCILGIIVIGLMTPFGGDYRSTGCRSAAVLYDGGDVEGVAKKFSGSASHAGHSAASDA